MNDEVDELEQTANHSATAPSNDTTSEDDDELVMDDLLVEEVSIDGMCGVY